MKMTARGITLVELLVVLAIVGTLLSLTLAAVDAVWWRVSLGSATTELQGAFRDARGRAVALDRNVAIKFRVERGEWTISLYADGDRDGVRNDDIARGVDRLLQRSRTIRHGRATIGIPRGPVRDPINGGLLSRRSAVRFGSSGLCSFSEDGDMSNGSVVLSDGKRAMLIATNGALRRTTLFRYDGSRWTAVFQ